MRNIPGTDVAVHPPCLGTNVFGWTADEPESFAVLDVYRAAGGNFVDIADSYSAWVPGNRGGESEEIIGRWMVKRGTRDAIVVATKVGSARSATSRPPTCRPSAGAYLDERGERVLAVLDAAAAAHEVPVAAVSLAWLAAQPTVVSPIASARTPGQLAELMAISDLELTADELRALDDASASSAVAQDGGALGQDRDLGGGEDLVV